MIKKTIYFILTIFIIVFSNNSIAYSETDYITVATASNIQFVMNDLKDEFKKESSIEIKTIINSSGKLSSQIQNSAPFDIFMSADMDYPRTLYKEGYAITKPLIYAYGNLVLWTMKDLNLSNWVETLKNSKINKIALANPKVAPYGEESINALKYYKIYDIVKDKLIYGESISQVNNYIVLNTTDIGFTSKSIVLSENMKNKGKWIDLDKKSYNPIAQGVVILKYGKENNYINSKKFYDFLFSKKSQKIFERYGYIVKK
ncbi:MAG: molybdate ABC transporter substrate-binding protein [Candidatus Sericytochromatia bacterium]